MKNVFQIVGVAIFVLLSIIIGKTLTLSSKQVPSENLKSIYLSDDIFQNLSKAIQYKTISYNEESIPDKEAFIGFHNFLKETFPLTHSRLTLEKINDYSLLFTWKGSIDSIKPIIFMSHQDVVPVDLPTIGEWEAGPFNGEITEKDIIGRGSLDDKSTLVGLLEAIEKLLEESFEPKRTIYLAFGHDEEVGGTNGAAAIANYLKEKGIKAAMTIDEGGFIGENLIDGLNNPIAMVNLAEKGFASFRLIVETNGGHSSAPPKDNTIGVLAQAILDLEKNQFPYKLVEPINHQIEFIGAELPLLKKIAVIWQRGRTSIFHLENYTKKSIDILLGKAGFKQVNIIFTNELSWPVKRYVEIYLFEKNILSKKLKFLSPIIAFMLYPFLASKFFNANKAIVIAQNKYKLFRT